MDSPAATEPRGLERNAHVTDLYPYQPDPKLQVPPASNGLGIAGFILGLVGVFFSLIPIIGLIAWVLVILGLIFSIIGLVRANRGASHKGLSIAGLVTSVVGLAICIAWVVIAGIAVRDAANEIQRVAKVEYEVTGTATDVTVRYGELLTNNEIKVDTLPWRKEQQNRGVNKGGTLTARTGTKGGSITCKITVDGKVVSTKTAEGSFAMADCLDTSGPR